MLGAARMQDWESLVSLENQRSVLVAKLANAQFDAPDAETRAIAAIILAVERENAEILERVQQWREDVKVLLRIPN